MHANVKHSGGRSDVALEDTYHVFREPDNVVGDPSLFSLTSVERNSRSGDFELAYATNAGLRENLRALAGAEARFVGQELPTRNHLLAVQRLPDGRLRVAPVASVVQFGRVFANDVKQKVVGRDDGPKGSLADSNRIQYRVISETDATI